VALEGAADKTVRGLTAEKDSDYDAILKNLGTLTGRQNVDSTRHANSNPKQSQYSNRDWEWFSTKHGQLPILKRKNMVLCYSVTLSTDALIQCYSNFCACMRGTMTSKLQCGKQHQYMDAQEQAKISALGKKPSVWFATSDPEPNQI